MSKRGLFILCGESFREGNSGTRRRDTGRGVKYQLEASTSHINLIKHLNSLGYHIDVSIITYETVGEEELLSVYTNVVYSEFTEIKYNDIPSADVINLVAGGAIKNTLSHVNSEHYSFIFLCRLDILLKDNLIQLFNPEWNEITYPNLMSLSEGGKDINISDLFVFIPNKYFTPFGEWGGLVQNADNILHHHCVVDLIGRGLSLEHHIGFMTDMCYIANTGQMKNPLYAIHCRAEGPEGCNKRYIKEIHATVDIP